MHPRPRLALMSAKRPCSVTRLADAEAARDRLDRPPDGAPQLAEKAVAELDSRASGEMGSSAHAGGFGFGFGFSPPFSFPRPSAFLRAQPSTCLPCSQPQIGRTASCGERASRACADTCIGGSLSLRVGSGVQPTSVNPWERRQYRFLGRETADVGA